MKSDQSEKRHQKINKKAIYYISIFLILNIFMFLCPIAGDDWGNYIEGTLGLRHIIGQAIGMYFDWEGRFISRILINILTINKIAWNIINSLLITSIIYLINKIVKPKHEKTITLLSTLVIFLTNIKTHGEVFTWLAGNITYLFVMPLILFYFDYIINHKNNDTKKIILFSILNIIMTMYVEHIAIILIAGNILILINRFIKNKKLDKEIIIYLICSSLGTTLMLLSPGSHKRSLIENVEFQNLSIIRKIIYNLPNLIYYTFTINYFLIVTSTISNYYLVKRTIKNRTIKILIYLYLIILPIINCLSYLLNNLNIITFSVNTSNPLIILYFISYVLIQLVMIYLYTKKDKINKILFFYLIGLGTNCIMLLSPTWGHRTSFATYTFLSVSNISIIDKNIKENKILNYILLIIIIFMSTIYLIMYISTHKLYQYNKEYIRKQLEEGKEEIEIIKYPYFISCNLNPDNPYHEKKFKDYYHIPQEKSLKLLENNWQIKIIYKNPN